jgi:hypothetical protein
MEHLPPVGWAEVATKRDIDALSVAISRDIGVLEMRSGGLEAKIDAVDARLSAKIDGLDAKIDAVDARLSAKIAESEARVSARLERELRLMTWRFVTVVVAVGSLVVASIRL